MIHCPRCHGNIFFYDNRFMSEKYWQCLMCARQYSWIRGKLVSILQMGSKPAPGKARVGMAMLPGER